MKHLPTRFLSLKFPTSKIKFDSIANQIHTFSGSPFPFSDSLFGPIKLQSLMWNLEKINQKMSYCTRYDREYLLQGRPIKILCFFKPGNWISSFLEKAMKVLID